MFLKISFEAMNESEEDDLLDVTDDDQSEEDVTMINGDFDEVEIEKKDH